NKSIPVRMAVISAGVIFNLIGAFAIFATIAGIGIDLPPAIIGEVMADGPADQAGLAAGDEVLEVDGKTKLDFTHLVLASALSKEGTKVPMKVRRRDGTIEDFEVSTAPIPGMKLRGFGIGQAQSLEIATIEGDDEGIEKMYAAVGLRGGDEVFAVDGRDVSAVWEVDEAIAKIRRPNVMLSARRSEDETGRTGLINTTLDLEMVVTSNYDISDESQLYQIHSMVPRMRVTAVTVNPVSDKSRVRILFEDKLRLRGLMEKVGLAGPAVKTPERIKVGDIIVKVGEVDFPTYLDLRGVTSEHDDKEMAITVLRRDDDDVLQTHELAVTPRTPPKSDKPLIGIDMAFDMETPVVAKTISTPAGPLPLGIPRGATITKVDGEAVSDFYDIIAIISKNAGQRISLEYRVDAKVAGSVPLNIPADNPHITVKSRFADMVPFDSLRRNYKAGNVVEIFSMGFRHMTGNVMQTYATLKALLSRRLGADALMGPIGIVSFSYKIVEARQFVFYLQFLGMISAMLAVLNFLPFPIVDGGVFLLLMIEKIKGSPVSMRVQQAIVYVGLALLLTLFIYVTCRDVLNLIVPQ
ncbi:MAG: site-2 protease family protein, partial [Planctomycetes bacterium]|nr:site-2 protease family protein [Planctomycetota bacterium]